MWNKWIYWKKQRGLGSRSRLKEDDGQDHPSWTGSGGQYVNDQVALGFRRLSIIDLDHGMQPMFNETGDVVIVFNGEIYNHLELREDLIAKGHVFANNADTESDPRL